MSTFFAHLRKEWRDQRAILLGIAVAIPLLLVAGLWLLGDTVSRVECATPFIVAGAVALPMLALSTELFAGESRRNTQRFLRRLPLGLLRAWAAKTFFYLLVVTVTAAYAAAVFLCVAALFGGPERAGAVEQELTQVGMTWPMTGAVVAVGLWILLVSTWIPKGGAAAGVALLMLGGLAAPVYLTMKAQPHFLLGWSAVPTLVWAFVLAPLFLSAWCWCRGARFATGLFAPVLRGLPVVLLLAGGGLAYGAHAYDRWMDLDPTDPQCRISAVFVGEGEHFAFVNAYRVDSHGAGIQGTERPWAIDLKTKQVRRLAPPGHQISSPDWGIGFARGRPSGTWKTLQITSTGEESLDMPIRWVDGESGKIWKTLPLDVQPPELLERLRDEARRHAIVRLADGRRAWTLTTWSRSGASLRATPSARARDGGRRRRGRGRARDHRIHVGDPIRLGREHAPRHRPRQRRGRLGDGAAARRQGRVPVVLALGLSALDPRARVEQVAEWNLDVEAPGRRDRGLHGDPADAVELRGPARRRRHAGADAPARDGPGVGTPLARHGDGCPDAASPAARIAERRDQRLRRRRAPLRIPRGDRGRCQRPELLRATRCRRSVGVAPRVVPQRSPLRDHGDGPDGGPARSRGRPPVGLLAAPRPGDAVRTQMTMPPIEAGHEATLRSPDAEPRLPEPPLRSPGRTLRMAAGCGAAAAGLGLAMLAAWHLDLRAVVSFASDSVEMRYVTALSFLACGAAMWGGARGRRRWPSIVALVGGSLGAVTLVEYLLGVDLAIDHLGPASQGVTAWPYPGRMAPNTAIAFLLTAFAVVLSNARDPTRAARGAATIAGCIVVGFAAVSALGYALGIPVGTAGGVFLPVAVPTAAGLLLLGVGIVARAAARVDQGPYGASAWLPLGILVGGMAFVLVLNVALDQREDRAVASRLDADAKLVQVEASETLSAPVEEVAHEAEVLAATPDMSQAEFEAASLRFGYGYGKSNTLAWVVPSLGRTWIRSAPATGPFQAPPLSAAGTAFVVPDPAGVGLALWVVRSLPGPGRAPGLLVAILDVDELLESQLTNHGLADDVVRIFDGSREVYRYGRADGSGPSAESRTVPIPVPTASFTATVQLTRERVASLRSAAPLLVLLGGASMFSLLAVAVYLATRARAREHDARETSRELGSEVSRHASTSDSLRRSAALLEGLFDSGPDAVVVVDPAGRIVRANERAVLLFGWSRAELLGLSVEQLVPVPLRDVHAKHRGELLATPAHPAIGALRDLSAVRHDGTEFPVDVSLARLASGRDSLVIAVVRDVTDRRKAAAALQGSEAQLRQAQKMEAVGRLAGGVAHDFNNLLCVILGYGQLVADELGPKSTHAAHLGQVLRAGHAAEALARQLLTFSRRQAVLPRVLDVNAVVREVETMLRRVIGEDVTLVTDLAAGPALAHVDAGQMEQVLMNLAVNARDAMPGGGRLTIRTTFDGGGAPWCATAPPIPLGSWVVLSVLDTGTGMDAATQARVFEPFFTTKQPGSGTGLGLATVHGIVHQSGGVIGFSSAPGQGTEFRIHLPRVAADVESQGSCPPIRPRIGVTRPCSSPRIRSPSAR